MYKTKKAKEDFIGYIKITQKRCEWLQALMHEKLVDGYAEIGCVRGLTVHLPALSSKYSKYLRASIHSVCDGEALIETMSGLTFSKVQENLKGYRESLP